MVSPDISKLMLILKMHSLSQGYSGISYEILERIQAYADFGVSKFILRPAGAGDTEMQEQTEQIIEEII